MSATAILALLDEPDYTLKTYALESLNENVEQIWAEVADHVSQLEELYEDKDFPAPQLAALVASKVYYNLGEFDSSMRYALVAGDKFDISNKSQYIETIVSICIDKYIELRQEKCDEDSTNSTTEEVTGIDTKLTAIVDKMLKSCIEAGQFNLALGVALESRRLDIIENILSERQSMKLIDYVLDCSISAVTNRQFRTRVLKALVPQIMSLESPNYFAVAKIIVQLNDAELALSLFSKLENSAQSGVALQVAFDLVAGASQELLVKVGSQTDDPTLKKVLSGVPTCDFNITFLQKNNNTDLQILNKTKSQLEGRSSIFHSAVSFQTAFMHAGTTADSFFRNNLEWLARATNWTKFTATAALGVIHQGNLSQGRNILQSYLPESQGSPYIQGGSLFALGLVFAGHGKEVLDYLRQHIVPEGGTIDADAEIVCHGAALGVGVAGMGSADPKIYGELLNLLLVDHAVAGEGAGLALGLVMLGSKNEGAEGDMFRYAMETEHEKIIRSCAIGIALINCGKEEAADDMIDQLMDAQDPILRYGGAFTIALAYAGTGNNKAIQRLLHTAVSDASDDVRRAAVMGLGFILLRNPQAVPPMVELLSESHNPHVRYGTAMALGVACAGTGLKRAVDVLEPMMKDPVDFVRQGALIALSMILIQQTERLFPRVKGFHEHFARVVASKHEDAMAKFGAALAQGIIDAGGRNVSISLEHSQTGILNTKAIVGLAVFLQYWYWFPLTHFLSLAFTPTSIIGVREDLKIPQFDFDCHAKAKLFGYPPKIETSNEKAPEKLVTAILSTTMRAKSRQKKKDEAKQLEEGTTSAQKSQKMEVDAPSSKPVATKEKEEESHKIKNMSRVLPQQLKYISFDGPDQRFVPVRKYTGSGGVIVVEDRRPEEKVEFVRTVRQQYEKDSGEAPLPEPFEYEDSD